MASFVFNYNAMESAAINWNGGVGPVARLKTGYEETRVADWLYRASLNIFRDFVFESSYDLQFFSTLHERKFRAYLALWELSFSEDDGKMAIAYYPDSRMKAAGRRFKARPGKAFKKIFPGIDDVTTAHLVDSYRKTFDVTQFEYGVAKTPKECADIFSLLDTEYQNPHCDYYRKSLANSCMRGGKDFSFLGTHPAQAYGSGDFEVHYLRNESGLCARVVVNVAKAGVPVRPTNAPLYGVSELSLNTLQEKLNAIGSRKADTYTWHGARIYAEDYKGNLIAPYLDCQPVSFQWDRESPFATIGESGNFSGGSYAGYQVAECQCSDCGNGIAPEYAMSHDGETYCESCYCDSFRECDHCGVVHNRDEMNRDDFTGYEYCESCFSRRFTCCDRCDSTVARSDTQSVNVWIGFRPTVETWCDDCADEDSINCTDGENWSADDCRYSESADVYISPAGDSDYFESDWDSEIYEIAVRVELSSGEFVSEDEIDGEGYIERNGIYYPEDELKEMDKEKARDELFESLALMVLDDDGAPLGRAAQFYAAQLPCLGLLPDTRDSCLHDGRQCDGNGYTCRYDSEQSGPARITLIGFNN